MSSVNDYTQQLRADGEDYGLKPSDELLQAMVEAEVLNEDKNSKQFNNFQEIRNEFGV